MKSAHATGMALIGAVEQRDFAQAAECLHPELTLRALVPGSIREARDAAGAVALLREWFGEAEEMALVRQSCDDSPGGLALAFQFAVREEGEWRVVEQHGFCQVRNGRIERMDLLCSGFRPLRAHETLMAQSAEPSVAPDAKHDELPVADATLEAAGEGCATLTPRIRSRMRTLASGQVLEVRADDPAARGDLQSWSRLAGHELVAEAPAETGETRFFVRKK